MITFNKIQRENIFGDDFFTFNENNQLEFGNKKIIVVYGPNGTGKTSLAEILKCKTGCEFDLEYLGTNHTHDNSNLFHVIDDQNGRNLIAGETQDFLLGDDIRREYDLKSRIDSSFRALFKQILVDKLKGSYKIKKRNAILTDYIENDFIKSCAKDIANTRSKGDNIDKNQFLRIVEELQVSEIAEYDETKFEYLITELEKNNTIIRKILNLNNETLEQNENISRVEHHNEAIKILTKYQNVDECIVCDSEICVEEKLHQKNEDRQVIYTALNDNTRDILETILKIVDDSDPFQLKNQIIMAMVNGDFTLIESVQNEINNYLSVASSKIINMFAETVAETSLIADTAEYATIISSRPELSDEDVLFIENIVSENINKEIELVRDEHNTLRLVLDGKEFLNMDRKELHLSNGEQNFISLSFELLKARNSDIDIIVLDDPISSFDSIYKNKIAFSIVKFLENKNQIILTHNVELIRLVEHQKQNCFNLYMFNNTPDESNGFFPLTDNEQEMLLYINKLIAFFRGNLVNSVEHEKLFLMSMIPFMRGYSQIAFKLDVKDNLTSLMHGYNDIPHNLNDIYYELFGQETTFSETHVVSAQDIINTSLENINILSDASNMPLLNRTLVHTLTYLYLRLFVEKELVDRYSINTRRHDMLSQMIFKSFSGNDIQSKRNRIFLASKKTLLNEFNHFEGNMNIFQPAIDITNSALAKEKDDIINFFNNL